MNITGFVRRAFRRRRATPTQTSHSPIATFEGLEELTNNVLVLLNTKHLHKSTLISTKNAVSNVFQKIQQRKRQQQRQNNDQDVLSILPAIPQKIIPNIVSAWSSVRKLDLHLTPSLLDESIDNRQLLNSIELALVNSLLLLLQLYNPNNNINNNINNKKKKNNSHQATTIQNATTLHRSAATTILNNSHCVEAIITHIQFALNLHDLHEKLNDDRLLLGAQCLHLLAQASQVRQRRVRRLLISRNLVPLLIGRMAHMSNIHHEQEQDKQQKREDIKNKIGRAAVQVLLSVNVLEDPSAWTTMLVDALTTIILTQSQALTKLNNNSSNNSSNSTNETKRFAVVGLLNVASTSKTTTSITQKDNESVWAKVVTKLAPLYAADVYSNSWFTLLVCRISSMPLVKQTATHIGLRPLLRSVMLNAYTRASRKPYITTVAVTAKNNNNNARESAACALSMLGDTLLPTSKLYSRSSAQGVKILCMDGGGTRGLATLSSLRALQKACDNKPIHQLFDVICGTSTGGILAVALGILHRPLEEVEAMYKEFVGTVFDASSGLYKSARTVVKGGMYAHEPLEQLLLEYGRDNGHHAMGEYGHFRQSLWDKTEYTTENKTAENTTENKTENTIGDESTSFDGHCRVFVVASKIGTVRKPQPYLFRNYDYHENGPVSRHSGTSDIPLWSALRATTSAPGYFAEHRIRNEIFGDGAVVANNPTGIAIHEALCLFPNRPIGCVVSLGTGRFNTDNLTEYQQQQQQQEVLVLNKQSSSDALTSSNSEEVEEAEEVEEVELVTASKGIWGNLSSAMSMVADTEMVHSLVLDLLSPRKDCVYVRMNPFIRPVPLNEHRLVILKQLQNEFENWLRREDGGKSALMKARNGLLLVGGVNGSSGGGLIGGLSCYVKMMYGASRL